MPEVDSSPEIDAKKAGKDRIKMVVLLVATIASFFTPFMGSSVNIALPVIGRDFGIDAVLLNWVTNGFLLAAAIFAVPFGRIADIHGMKKIFTYGMVIFTIASLLCALSPNALTLIGSRVLQGIGSAMIF
ncbi:MAG: MFS transporter, partial [Methanobacteriaceae archaeon]|nr:MFS transporter [Methanobacteriaceae archaeon]